MKKGNLLACTTENDRPEHPFFLVDMVRGFNVIKLTALAFQKLEPASHRDWPVIAHLFSWLPEAIPLSGTLLLVNQIVSIYLQDQ